MFTQVLSDELFGGKWVDPVGGTVSSRIRPGGGGEDGEEHSDSQAELIALRDRFDVNKQGKREDDPWLLAEATKIELLR